ncbi:MAG: LPS assembly lipoprotein LptE [Pseudomonadota bacterium]
MSSLRGFQTALLVGLAIVLAGCGFQLRGSAALPPELDALNLGIPENHPLARELSTLLSASGRQVVAPDKATAQLQFEQNDLLRDVQSVGATARVREFALRYNVSFRVVSADGREIQPLTSLEIYRDYTFDQGQVLGAASEEEFLRDEMTREMANRILRSLSSG